MPGLAAQRCFNHARREAAARCAGCRHFFCRECVSEHEDSVLCAACLLKLAARPERGHRWGGVARATVFLLSLVALWFAFHAMGEALLGIPTSFHEGTLWKTHWLDGE